MGNSCLISAALKVYIARIIMFGWTWILGLRHVQICTLHGSKATCLGKDVLHNHCHSLGLCSVFPWPLYHFRYLWSSDLMFWLISAHVSPGLLLSVLQWCVRVCKGITRSTATVLKRHCSLCSRREQPMAVLTEVSLSLRPSGAWILCPLINQTTVHTVQQPETGNCLFLKNSLRSWCHTQSFQEKSLILKLFCCRFYRNVR